MFLNFHHRNLHFAHFRSRSELWLQQGDALHFWRWFKMVLSLYIPFTIGICRNILYEYVVLCLSKSILLFTFPRPCCTTLYPSSTIHQPKHGSWPLDRGHREHTPLSSWDLPPSDTSRRMGQISWNDWGKHDDLCGMKYMTTTWDLSVFVRISLDSSLWKKGYDSSTTVFHMYSIPGPSLLMSTAMLLDAFSQIKGESSKSKPHNMNLNVASILLAATSNSKWHVRSKNGYDKQNPWQTSTSSGFWSD